MQTFLPYPDFQKSVESLDYRRLGKQRVECKQLLNALAGQSKGWVNHPAARMWRGHEDALKAYMAACIVEWVKRGYNNTMPIPEYDPNYTLPFWIGYTDFHISHQSNLIRKDASYYSPQFPGIPSDLPYIWPVQ